jgi:hypothetical protein
MKKMKWTLLVIAMFSISFTSIAQERVNAAGITFDKKSDQLTKAVGWDFYEGKWQDHINIAGNSLSSSFIDTSHYSNFYWLQTASFTYKGKKYYTIFCQVLTGKYKYPSLREDWETRQESKFMVMTPAQYQILKQTISSKAAKNQGLPCYRGGSTLYGSYNEAGLQKSIVEQMEVTSYPAQYKFYINSQSLKGEDIIRFMLPTEGIDDKAIESNYFEVPAADFKKLLID